MEQTTTKRVKVVGLNRPESVGCSAFGVQAATKRAETAHNAKFFMVDISIIIN